MRSGNCLDRVLKLWISLWTLVLEDKRHLETVCATLQSLVFERTGWPTFKNWPAICELGRTNGLMMWVAATLDMSKVENDVSVQWVIATLPECFSDKEVRGPVPWSVLKEAAARRNQEDVSDTLDESDLREYNRLYAMNLSNVLSDHNIPSMVFAERGSAIAQDSPDMLFIPDGICASTARVGDKVRWRNCDWIVVENNTDQAGNLDIVPAECIDLTL